MVIFVIFLSILLAAIVAISRSRRAILYAGILAFFFFVFQSVSLLNQQPAIMAFAYGIGICFLTYIISAILSYVFQSKRVTLDTISASLCVYLLLGVLWAILYSMTELLLPGSFHYSLADAGEASQMRFGTEHSSLALYYSLVTMTTLGYGDIVPTTPTARVLSTLQAVIGQIYIAVLVARLVGIQVAQATVEGE